jgi:hypothetical protein
MANFGSIEPTAIFKPDWVKPDFGNHSVCRMPVRQGFADFCVFTL